MSEDLDDEYSDDLEEENEDLDDDNHNSDDENKDEGFFNEEVQGQIGCFAIVIGIIIFCWYFGTKPKTPGTLLMKSNYLHFIESKELWSSYFSQDEMKLFDHHVDFIDNSMFGTSSTTSVPIDKIKKIKIARGVNHFTLNIKPTGFNFGYNYVFQDSIICDNLVTAFNPTRTGIVITKSNTLLYSFRNKGD